MNVTLRSGRSTVTPLWIVVGIVAAHAAAGTLTEAQGPRCRDSSNIPLTDLAVPYRGLDFGLYPGRRTTPSADYLALGLDRARRVRPLDAVGRPSPLGKIVLISMGMSNTSSEFGRFAADARTSLSINTRLSILNASLSGADAARWTDPEDSAWRHALSTVSVGRESSPKQVQVIWLKQAHLRTVPFPAEADAFAANVSSSLRIALSVFPNLQLVYISSRTRAGASTRRGPGEPQAYETGFGVRRVIERHIAAVPDSTVDPPWVSWGPYLWATERGRSDGLEWDCGDVRADMLHPTESGDLKVAKQLMTFFMSAESAVSWFLEPSLGGQGPVITAVSPLPAAGQAPLTVTFTPTISGASEYFWSFGDGTGSMNRNPTKTFHVSGVYRVGLTAVDRSGRWARSLVQIRVGMKGKEPAVEQGKD